MLCYICSPLYSLPRVTRTKIDRFFFVLRMLNCWLWIRREINNHNIGHRGKKSSHMCVCATAWKETCYKARRTLTKWLKFRGVAKPASMRNDEEKGFPSSREQHLTIAEAYSWPRVTHSQIQSFAVRPHNATFLKMNLDMHNLMKMKSLWSSQITKTNTFCEFLKENLYRFWQSELPLNAPMIKFDLAFIDELSNLE